MDVMFKKSKNWRLGGCVQNNGITLAPAWSLRNSGTVNTEIFARILFSRIALKDTFAT